MASGWYREPVRHGLAAKGVKTAKDNPKRDAWFFHTPTVDKDEEGRVKFGYKIDEVWEGQQTYTPEEYEKKKELDAAIKKQGLKFFSVLHAQGYPDDAKTFVIEHTQQARLLAKDEKDARKQVKKAYGTGILEVSEIDDQDEIDELKRMILKQEK